MSIIANSIAQPGNIICSAGSSQITGSVFQDFNYNGLYNSGELLGVGGITVTATDAAGNAFSATTGVTGNYTISGLTAGQTYRVEFTLPASLSWANPTSFNGDNGTTVQFLMPGNCANLGVSAAQDYCQSNPKVAVNCFVQGDPFVAPPPLYASTAMGDALVTFPYNASGASATSNTLIANAGNIGAATWGVAYQRTSQSIFVGAVQRRHSGYGILGTGGIYQIDNSAAVPVINNFINLNTIPGINTGANPHTGLPGCREYNTTCISPDPASFDAVGKISLGDVEISEDDQTLWAINLNERTLIKMNIGTVPTVPTAGDITVYPMIGNGAPSCTNGQFRPWALKTYRGKLYIGGVCSAESGGTAADLDAYILEFDPANPGAGFSTIFNFGLDYPKGCAKNYPTAQGCAWNPWTNTWPFPSNQDYVAYPQPILSDIEFDIDGSMILGFMDRWYLQGGNSGPLPNGTGDVHVVNGGDIIRVCNIGGTFVLQGSTGCPNKSNNNEGPGGGEFYYQDGPGSSSYWESTESSHGALALLPGSNEVMTTVIEPFNDRWEAGIYWHNNTTGQRTDRYNVYKFNFANGKGLGLGDIELLCNSAPIEIGNRVWVDTDGDGIQDPDEAPIAGVTIQLIKGSTIIATAITNGNGNYYFSSGPGTNTSSAIYGITQLKPSMTYTIRISNVQGGSKQTALGVNTLTTANVGGTGQPDVRDSDGTLVGDNADVTVTTSDIPTSGANNHNFDFGFRPAPLCVDPVFMITQTTPTCIGATAQNNGIITLTAVTNADKLGVSTGATYSGTPNYAGATAIGTLPLDLQTAIPNMGGTYTIRFFNGADNCFRDTTITVAPVTCTCPPNTHDICPGDTFTLDAGAGLTGIQWFKDGQPITNATNQTYLVTTAGSYHFEAVSGGTGCTANGCCPAIFVVGNCTVPCPPKICLPVTISRN